VSFVFLENSACAACLLSLPEAAALFLLIHHIFQNIKNIIFYTIAIGAANSISSVNRTSCHPANNGINRSETRSKKSRPILFFVPTAAPPSRRQQRGSIRSEELRG
jgi:hypothetical protein